MADQNNNKNKTKNAAPKAVQSIEQHRSMRHRKNKKQATTKKKKKYYNYRSPGHASTMPSTPTPPTHAHQTDPG